MIKFGNRHAYAKHRGLKPARIYALVSSGKIKLHGGKKIDFAEADEVLDAEQNPARVSGAARRWHPERADPDVQAESAEVAEVAEVAEKRRKNGGKTAEKRRKNGGEEKDDAEITNFQIARTLREKYAALNERAKYLETVGLLVSVGEVAKVATRRYRGLREGLLNLADRLSPILAAEHDPVKIHLVMTREIKQSLEELANQAQAEAGAA